MELKEKIKNLRKSKNMSQENLAELLNISRQAITKWESGEAYPDINNLIALSNLFQISIDRLLKEDYCQENLEDKEIEVEEAICFLMEAKKKTYAGGGKQEEISTRPKSHDLLYEQGKYKYIDTYLGGERFTGEEALFENNEPIWAMNYSGIEKSEKFSGSFLKEALSNVPENLPFRGPTIFKAGDNLYLCHVTGDFTWFQGKEEIYCQNELVYECFFHGGIIK